MLSLARSAKEPLGDRKSAERWVAWLARHDPIAATAHVVRELKPLAHTAAHRTPAELEALFCVDAHVEHIRGLLVDQYVEHAGHSSETEERIWHAMLDLAQAFALAYGAYLREMRGRLHDPRWQAHLPELLARSVEQLAFDARVRMFRYERWIPGKWRELHDVFAVACMQKIARQKVSLDAAREPVTIERRYIALLLLQLANAGNLKPAHVEWLWRQMDNWCAPLKLRITTRSPTALFVDLSEPKGLSRRTLGGVGGEVLFLDTRHLLALLRHYVMAVEQKIRNHPLSINTPRRVERLAVLTKITAQIDGQFTPVQRRGERVSASGEVDVVLGLSRICEFLSGAQQPSVHELETVSSFSGTLDLAIFGRLRNGETQRAHAARQRLARYAAPGGAWEVKDVSATGLRLVAPLAAAHAVTLGTVAALRGVGQSVWTLGIVRRIRRLTADRAEIGMQRIADTISTVELVAEAPAAATAPAGRSREPHAFHALFLALNAPGRHGAVQSLILPRPDHEGAHGLKLRTHSSALPVRFGRTIEEQADWLWIAVEPASARNPAAPAATAVAP